jgi:hypothetical protein
MRHLAHSCVTLWTKKTLKSPLCDTVLAQSADRIALMAKGAGTYL